MYVKCIARTLRRVVKYFANRALPYTCNWYKQLKVDINVWKYPFETYHAIPGVKLSKRESYIAHHMIIVNLNTTHIFTVRWHLVVTLPFPSYDSPVILIHRQVHGWRTLYSSLVLTSIATTNARPIQLVSLRLLILFIIMHHEAM